MILLRKIGSLFAGALILFTAGTGFGGQNWYRTNGHGFDFHNHVQSFQRIATLANYLNNADIADETVSEINAATKDGMTLIYTDSPLEQIGFIDITDPASPEPAGKLDVGGEPTSVDVLGNRFALVAVNTSESYVNPRGKLVVVDVATHEIVKEIDLGGQPDSIKISPDGRYAAIAIENERDEDVVVDGVEGGLPQLPAGYLVIIDMVGTDPDTWARRDVDLTGLAVYAPEDPEPEFVDINEDNEVVVTLQENNHVVIVDLASGGVTGDFALGTVTLNGVDAKEDGIISLTDVLTDVPREPDGVTWVPFNGFGRYGRHGHSAGYAIATANEGDLFGGSRGFSIFQRDGKVMYDSGTSYEEIAVRFGHYPEDRSENKGSEPESVEYGRFDGKDYLFVGSERGSFIAVYELHNLQPEFKQLLPAPLGPEGLLAIPSRNLLIASGEEDDPSYGVRSSVMIYAFTPGQPTYPQILSDDWHGTPIPWSALSGMVALPGPSENLLAVWDSYYSESMIFRIDASNKPAVITKAMPIVGGTGNYDPEGIALAPDHTIWVASEGNANDSRPNRLLQLDYQGNVIKEVGLPDEILSCRAASSATGTLGSGFEGVAVRQFGKKYKLLVAQQRGWDYTTPECEDLDDDDGGLDAHNQPLRTRIWIYDPQKNTWDHIAWELAPLPANASWVGLSEITRTPMGDYVLIERDNRTGDFAELKTLVKVDLREARDGLIERSEKSVFDLLPALEETNGWVTDKPEGFAITDSGQTYVVTDNDGVEDWSGETWFLQLGQMKRLFR